MLGSEGSEGRALVVVNEKLMSSHCSLMKAVSKEKTSSVFRAKSMPH